MSARDGVCKGCKDIGIANRIACLQRRFREDLAESIRCRRTKERDDVENEKEETKDDASGNQRRRQ